MIKNRRMRNKIFVGIMCAMLLSGCDKEVPYEALETVEETKDEGEEESKGFLYVYVCGAVKKPGVYVITEGDRITHVLEAAGGMTKDAAKNYLNLAELVEDGQQIYVPFEDEIKKSSLSTENETDDGKVNLNTADVTQLQTLSGIGESRALAIIAYREESGGFKKIEDIQNVAGIKDGIFQRIKDQIKVE